MHADTHFSAKLDALAAQNQLRRLRPLPDNAVNFSGNDYLGIAADGSLQRQFFAEYSGSLPHLGSTSSRLLTGDSSEHRSLEQTLEQAYGRPALLFNSGYHANIGILPALADKQTLILADKLVHASIIDGIRLAAAPYKRFRHNDIAHLRRLLAGYAADFERIIVVTESLFSMDGDFAPLAELVALKKHYPQLMLYVDEAHAVGVYGESGLGWAQAQGCLNDIDILVGTFGKAAASVGAYAVCSPTLRNWLINQARPLIFSTNLPPLNAAWSEYIFRRFGSDTLYRRRQHLAELAAQLRQSVQAAGFDSPSESHIIPCITGSNAAAERLAQHLQHAGCYALPVRPPTVPAGSARIRFSLSAALCEADIERAADIIRRYREQS